MINLAKFKRTKKCAKAKDLDTKTNEENNETQKTKTITNYFVLNCQTYSYTCPICESKVIQEDNCPNCHLRNPNFDEEEFFGERNQ